ncbi:cytochrome c peroxidase [Roseiflexus castenholzii]|uniref:cytochrome c peroxidase n=1 Tax=Roseiflexus castenholzii TaxID=120962 RepID=UPI003C7B58CF
MQRFVHFFSPALLIAVFITVIRGDSPVARTPAPGESPQAMIALGRRLFYDRRLSANEQIACAACHRQELGFSDGRVVSNGATGALLRRNAPGLFNSGELLTFTWANVEVRTLEQQVERALFTVDPPEMGVRGYETTVIDRLRADPEYLRQFTAAFPTDDDPFTWRRITGALAAFVRSLAARNTPYDRYVYAGDRAALSDSAQRGMALFFSPGLACGHCHVDVPSPERATPPRWSDLAYVATGAGYSADRGLAEQTGNPADAYRFRVPPLRNVAVTAPYMHDGSLPTLEAVIRFYESGGQWGAGVEPERAAARHPLIAGFALSDEERRDLIAFLEALTDDEALRNPAFADPFLSDARTPSVRSLSR